MCVGALAAGQELGRWDGYGANEEEERFDDSATLYFVPGRTVDMLYGTCMYVPLVLLI
jgi:hypothetical protein